MLSTNTQNALTNRHTLWYVSFVFCLMVSAYVGIRVFEVTYVTCTPQLYSMISLNCIEK